MIDTTQNVKVGRLALREEGNLWNAYYAMPGTMEGAILLGSMRLAATLYPGRKDAFIALMREIVGDIIQHETGIRPVWGGLEAAPETERGSRA